VRYYLGVDWADQTHAVWVVGESGTKITARTVTHTAEGLGEWGRELDEWRAQDIALWAAIRAPARRVVYTGVTNPAHDGPRKYASPRPAAADSTAVAKVVVCDVPSAEMKTPRADPRALWKDVLRRQAVLLLPYLRKLARLFRRRPPDAPRRIPAVPRFT
jgi:hypothetical protein